MEYKDIRDKQPSELQEELINQRKHLFALRTQAVTEKLEDPTQLRKTRKDIARVMTALRQHEIKEEKSKAPVASVK